MPSRSSRAATSRTQRVSSGRSRARAEKARSRRSLIGRASGNASLVTGSSCIEPDSSTSASGLPAASRTIRSHTPAGKPGARERTIARATSSSRGRSVSSSMPAASIDDNSSSRAASSRTSGSDPSRRATNASASCDGRSSHWTSSATTRIGVSAAASVRSVSVAMATRNGSSAASDVSPNAAASASRWGPGSRSRPPRIGRRSWWRPANGRCASVRTPTARRTRIPRVRAVSIARPSRADLPIPASPRIRSAPPPSPVRPTKSSIACSSRSRPKIPISTFTDVSWPVGRPTSSFAHPFSSTALPGRTARRAATDAEYVATVARYTISTQVAAPPEQVFALWTNLERMGEWVGGVTGVQ